MYSIYWKNKVGKLKTGIIYVTTQWNAEKLFVQTTSQHLAKWVNIGIFFSGSFLVEQTTFQQETVNQINIKI